MMANAERRVYVTQKYKFCNRQCHVLRGLETNGPHVYSISVRQLRPQSANIETDWFRRRNCRLKAEEPYGVKQTGAFRSAKRRWYPPCVMRRGRSPFRTATHTRRGTQNAYDGPL